MLTMR